MEYDKIGMCYRGDTKVVCGLCPDRCYWDKIPYELSLDYRSSRYFMPLVIYREDYNEDDMEEDGIEFRSATARYWRLRVPLCYSRMSEVAEQIHTQRAHLQNSRLPIAAELRRLSFRKHLPRNVAFQLWDFLYGPRRICIFCC